MKATATIVFFELPGKKKYVSELTIRPDNTIIPIYSDDIEEAHHFIDEQAARARIEKFHNVHHRQFKTESVQVIVSNRNPFSSKAKGALID